MQTCSSHNHTLPWKYPREWGIPLLMKPCMLTPLHTYIITYNKNPRVKPWCCLYSTVFTTIIWQLLPGLWQRTNHAYFCCILLSKPIITRSLHIGLQADRWDQCQDRGRWKVTWPSHQAKLVRNFFFLILLCKHIDNTSSAHDQYAKTALHITFCHSLRVQFNVLDNQQIK